MRRTETRRAGFTLVELLTVIAIIGLLIGILVPSLTAVRRSARDTATRSVHSTLATAIATFQADQKVGGALPPSMSDADGVTAGSPKTWQVRNPYIAQGVTNDQGTNIRIAGAGLLVWALAGADLLGTPGFRTFRSTSALWSMDTDGGSVAPNATNFGAYALNNSTNQPMVARSGPYVDMSKVKVTSLVKKSGGSSFDIPAEVEAREQGGQPAAVRKFPVFLDGHGFPVLYYRADLAGVRMADAAKKGGNPQAPTGDQRGIYHYNDNDSLLGTPNPPELSSGPNNGLILRPTRESNFANIHKLSFTFLAPNADPQQNPGPARGFHRYIRNKGVTAKFAPHNADSFLLISPGADGRYGTADDIANFDHNGAETERE